MTPIENTVYDSGISYARRRQNLRALINTRTAGNIAAFADQFGYSRSRVSQFLSDTYNDGRSIGERAARALEEAAGLSIGWLDAVDAPATATGHAAQLQRAIADARAVFESEPAAGEALDYLQAVLAAGAVIPAQTGITSDVPDQRTRMLQLAGEVADARTQAKQHGLDMQVLREDISKLREKLFGAQGRNRELEHQLLALFGPAAGGADASIAKETHTGAGAEPVAGAKVSEQIIAGINAARFSFANLPDALLAIEYMVQVLCCAGVSIPAAMVKGARDVRVAADQAAAADRAAAAMAAESAQLVADAERSVAKKAVAAGIDPLSVLSREVNGLSNKLQLPADLTVQLMVLAELRGLRS